MTRLQPATSGPPPPQHRLLARPGWQAATYPGRCGGCYRHTFAVGDPVAWTSQQCTAGMSAHYWRGSCCATPQELSP